MLYDSENITTGGDRHRCLNAHNVAPVVIISAVYTQSRSSGKSMGILSATSIPERFMRSEWILTRFHYMKTRASFTPYPKRVRFSGMEPMEKDVVLSIVHVRKFAGIMHAGVSLL
jgi:hypothetical protein